MTFFFFFFFPRRVMPDSSLSIDRKSVFVDVNLSIFHRLCFALSPFDSLFCTCIPYIVVGRQVEESCGSIRSSDCAYSDDPGSRCCSPSFRRRRRCDCFCSGQTSAAEKTSEQNRRRWCSLATTATTTSAAFSGTPLKVMSDLAPHMYKCFAAVFTGQCGGKRVKLCLEM